jgi:hypothetical protein
MTNNHEIIRETLEGRVAAILNERELAINIGESNGVRVGMKFKVLSDQLTEIYDPDTNEVLGVIDREKVRVQAVVVQKKFSVCRTYRKHITKAGPFYNINVNFTTRDLFAPPREIPETLKAEDSFLPQSLPEEESFIRKGDRVFQLFDDPEE